MYQVVVERAAGKDLKRLASGIQPALPLPFALLPKTRDQPAAANSPERRTIGKFESVITA